MDDLVVDDSTVIPARDLSWVAVRSTGPGGQNVNKVATKVVLRFDLANTEALAPRAKLRLQMLAGKRLGQDGIVQIASDASRNQITNLRDARQKLVELVRDALHEPKPRRPTKPTAASRRRRVQDKRMQSARKEQRRKPGSEG